MVRESTVESRTGGTIRQFGKIAVENFGLTEAERVQIELLKGCERFGYLIDIDTAEVGAPASDERILKTFAFWKSCIE